MKNRQPQGIAKNVSLAYGPDGMDNGSYQFHGNTASYIEFPNNGGLVVQHSITMLCWVYFSQNTTGPLFVYGDCVAMFISNNKLFAKFINLYCQSFSTSEGTELTLNQWHYVGASYDYNTGNVSLWVNATRFEQKNFDTKVPLGTTRNVRMGSHDTWHFVGRITAMQVYDVALTKKQIEAVRCAGHAGRGKNVNCNNTVRFLSS